MSSFFERVRAALAEKGYQVERELASGGMGTVFLARQRALDRPVAIKIIRPELYTAQAAERFRQEAQTLASFSHPNIVPIHDADESRRCSAAAWLRPGSPAHPGSIRMRSRPRWTSSSGSVG